MRVGVLLTGNRFFNRKSGGNLFAKTGPILLDSNTFLLLHFELILGILWGFCTGIINPSINESRAFALLSLFRNMQSKSNDG